MSLDELVARAAIADVAAKGGILASLLRKGSRAPQPAARSGL
jgi:hypothetical protein